MWEKFKEACLRELIIENLIFPLRIELLYHTPDWAENTDSVVLLSTWQKLIKQKDFTRMQKIIRAREHQLNFLSE